MAFFYPCVEIWGLFLPSYPVVPNHCSRDHKCSASSHKVLPEKFKIRNILCLKMKFDPRYEGFSDKFIVRCSATFKRLGNTALTLCRNGRFSLQNGRGISKYKKICSTVVLLIMPVDHLIMEVCKLLKSTYLRYYPTGMATLSKLVLEESIGFVTQPLSDVPFKHTFYQNFFKLTNFHFFQYSPKIIL